MILIKIDSLSTQELRNIAEGEGIENYETLEREELIQILREIYEEEDDVAERADVNRRFLYGITDYRDIDKNVVELPGVEELPESYPNTEIHLLYKNPDWAYCYWGISPQDLTRLENLKKGELKLRTTVVRNGVNESFDIPVSIEDTEWTVSLPSDGGECYVSLIVDASGEDLELAHSSRIKLAQSYWLEHKEEIKDMTKTDAAKVVGKKAAERAIAAGVKEVVFDRGGYIYTGRVKSVADGAREAGLKF